MVSFSSYCLLLVYPFIVNSFPYFSIPLFIAFQSFEFAFKKSFISLYKSFSFITACLKFNNLYGISVVQISLYAVIFAGIGFRAELTIVLCIAMLVVFYKSTHYIANLLGRLIYC